MKKTLLLLLVLLFASGLWSQVTEGDVVYEMLYTSDDPGMETTVEMMAGSQMLFFFAPGKSRSEVSLGQMGLTTIISDDNAKKSVTLMNISGMKYAMENKYSELKSEKDLKKEFTVKPIEGTREILGYTCSAIRMTSKYGPDTEIWYTKDITASSTGHTYHNAVIPGFPLSFSFVENGMNTTITAVRITKTAPDPKLFSLTVPAEYE